jgi:hypothetical protein
MTLDKILAYCNYIASKEVEGRSMTIEQFNTVIDVVDIELFNFEWTKLEMAAAQTGQPLARLFYSSSVLRPFKVFYGVSLIPGIAMGILSLPIDYAHYITVAVEYNGSIREVDILTDKEMIARRGSVLHKNLSLYPAGVVYNNYIQMYPKDVSNIEITYLRNPITPFYDHCIETLTAKDWYMPVGSYTQWNGPQNRYDLYTVGGVLIIAGVTHAHYNGLPGQPNYISLSVEFEWEERVHIILEQLILEKMGINLQSEQIQRYNAQKNAQQQSQM